MLPRVLTLVVMNTSENAESLSDFHVLRSSNLVNKGSDHHFQGLQYMKIFKTRID